MSLTIGISTSSPQFKIVFGKNGQVIFDSELEDLSDEVRKNLTALTKEGLSKIECKPKDIKKVVVDIGPGGTSRVRSGVAFANGLSYGLKIPICPIPSLAIIAKEAWDKFKLPVISTANSIKTNAYVGVYNCKLDMMEYGDLKEVFEKLTAGLEEVVVAGFHREELIELFPTMKIHDSKIKFANANLMITEFDSYETTEVMFPHLPIPITENTIPVYE